MAETRKSELYKSERPDDSDSRAYPELQRLMLDRMGEILPRVISARENANEQGEQIQSGPADEADLSVFDTTADYFLRLASNHQRELLELRDALERMRRGTYGFCETCETPISVARLKKLPAARLCIDCQAAIERSALVLVQGGRRHGL